MSRPDHYETLGVSKGAAPDEIRQAYRRMSAKHHPDREGGDEEKMKAVNEAFETLSDPAKRKVYDEGGDPFDRSISPEESVILEAFVNAVSEDPAGQYDWLDQTRARLKNHRAFKEASMKSLRGQINRLEKGLKKLKFKGKGAPFLIKVIEVKLQALRREVGGFEVELPLYDRALAMLDDYGWEGEAHERPASADLYARFDKHYFDSRFGG